MSELDLLTTLLESKIRYNAITSDGNCFFHALEYALGNCDIGDKKNPLYNQTRQEVSDLLIAKYNEDLDLMDLVNEVDTKNHWVEIERIQEKIKFMQHFRNSYVYSTEEVIYFSALLKKKILFIVREEPDPDGFVGDFQTTLIIPKGVPIRPENVLVMIHSDGIHYNTLQYPLKITDKFLTMIRRYNDSPDGLRFTDVPGISIKVGILKTVLRHYVGLNQIIINAQIRSNHEMALRLASEVNLNLVIPEKSKSLDNAYSQNEINRMVREIDHQVERKKQENLIFLHLCTFKTPIKNLFFLFFQLIIFIFFLRVFIFFLLVFIFFLPAVNDLLLLLCICTTPIHLFKSDTLIFCTSIFFFFNSMLLHNLCSPSKTSKLLSDTING